MLSLAVMVFLMVTGLVPNVIAALIACQMMGVFRCIDMDSPIRPPREFVFPHCSDRFVLLKHGHSIAMSTAGHLDAFPYPFAMIVALAASAAFMTPVSSPVNTLVMGLGKYRLIDFMKIGVRFALLVLLVCIILVPWLLPLH